MIAGHLAAWTGAGFLALVTLAALTVGLLLLFDPDRDRAGTWLGARLLGSALLVASLAALSLGGLDDPRGSLWQLAGLAGAVAGISLHLLDVPFALARTRERGAGSLPSWILGLPLIVPLGFLAYASVHWPSSTLPASSSPAEWTGWAGYDAVEDAAGGLASLCLLLAALVATLLLVERALRARGPRRARARRMLAQAWVPVLVWTTAVGFVWIGLAIQEPPASGGLLVAQEILLDGPVAFSLAVVGPLLWGWDERKAAGLGSHARAPQSNRS